MDLTIDKKSVLKTTNINSFELNNYKEIEQRSNMTFNLPVSLKKQIKMALIDEKRNIKTQNQLVEIALKKYLTSSV